MDISYFLAKFWGLLIIIIATSFLVDKNNLKRSLAAVKDDGFVIVTGLIATILGLATVLLHNIWTLDWRVFITLFGWTSLIKGIIRLVKPEFVNKSMTMFKNESTIKAMLIFGIVVGAFMTYKGFFTQ